LELLDINGNRVTSTGLVDITRMIKSAQLKTIRIFGNESIFNDQDATQHFVSTLEQKKSSVEDMPHVLDYYFYPEFRHRTICASIRSSLTRNQQLNRVVALLLVPQLPTPQQQQGATTSMMLYKILAHKAIAKFATIGSSNINNNNNNGGASAIFQLFQVQPALLKKKQIKRPSPAAAAAAAAATTATTAASSTTGSLNNAVGPKDRSR
jgi:hypothetical protein